MSHELRTPLNSLMILAQQLYENPEGNLSETQVRFAKTIHSCGDDLIQLINDILDLSKIESGFISAEFLPVRLWEICSFVETTFRPISEAKHLKFNIEVDDVLPEMIETDLQRLNQILKNLLSNAFKFTEKGEVRLKIYQAHNNWKGRHPSLDQARNVVAFAISDTGIGISKDKQNIIFEAFQQAEGSTSRKYGGTGLGLSISRGLADLLGGTIELESEVGDGSTFTLFIPLELAAESKDIHRDSDVFLAEKPAEKTVIPPKAVPVLGKVVSGANGNGNGSRLLEEVNELMNPVGDDRNHIQPTDKVLLVVEDDLRFGKIVMDKAHEKDYKVVIATSYAEVFDYVNTYHPVAVTLDIKLPGNSGWKILDLFKNDLNFRHIPVYLISGEENRTLAYKRGARGFLLKPLKSKDFDVLFEDIASLSEKHTKRLLLVEDNELDASGVMNLLRDVDISVTTAPSGEEALSLLQDNSYDCVLLDYMLPDMAGIDLLQKIRSNRAQFNPLLVYSAKNFTDREMGQLKQLTKGVIGR
jgi:DNA-binding response OmpR family regulator/two-component sensor histidine kinase